MTGVEQYVLGERIAERIARLAEIGALPSGGMRRLPYTPEDRVAREVFSSWLSDLGLRVHMDGAGNVVGRREGLETGATIVMTGSHLDTQPTGGRFDGIAGVVAAVEAMEAMREANFAHRHPIEVVDFAAGEIFGRFDLPMIGSSAMVGSLTPEALESRDRLTGLTLREVMTSVGIDTAVLPAAERAPGSIEAVTELHIEQGPYLERVGKQVGVVTEVAGSTRIHCVVKGQQAHSGGMPMDCRRDALCGAAEVVLAVEAAAKSRVRPSVVATVGVLFHEPQAFAIIPGHARMVIDIRSVDARARSEVASDIQLAVEGIAKRRNLSIEWSLILSQTPVKLSTTVVDTIAKACEELGVSYERMASGGGHDAMTLARRFPSGMLFVPSIDGISHAPEEFTRIEDLVLGTKVLCRTLCIQAR